MSAQQVSEARKQAFKAVSQALAGQDVEAAVAHGTETLPDRLGRDVDILVARGSLKDAAICASEGLRSAGWRAIEIEMPWKVIMVIGFSRVDGRLLAFESDFLIEQIWCGCPLVENVGSGRSLERIEGFPISKDLWASFVKRCLVQVLAGNWHKISGKIDEFQLSDVELEILEPRMKRLAGTSVWEELKAACLAGDVSALKSVRPTLRKAILKRALRSPVKSFKSATRWFKYRCALQWSRKQRAPLVLIAKGGKVDNEWVDQFQERIKERLVFPACHVQEVDGSFDTGALVKKLTRVELVILVTDNSNDQAKEEISDFQSVCVEDHSQPGETTFTWENGWQGDTDASIEESLDRVVDCFISLHSQI